MKNRKKHLSRTSDPATSGEAADQLDLTFRSQHDRLITWLEYNGPATDQEIAVAMVSRGIYNREETARRAARTVREQYGLMVPAFAAEGERLRHKNPNTGKSAYCWQYGRAPVQSKPTAPTPMDRLTACRIDGDKVLADGIIVDSCADLLYWIIWGEFRD